jgi:outer membrane protein assembly factor BamB
MRYESRSTRLLAFIAGCLGAAAIASASGWHSWRGPDQNGVSTAKVALPDSLEVNGPNHRWSYAVQGAGTPVIADGRVFAFGFYGQTTDVVETLLCIDNKTGKKIWEHTFRDFLSDNVYNRYAIGAPTVDPDTGNVYVGSTPGLIMGFTRDGKKLWERSIMEEFGAITFPNGRTGAPAIDGYLVIINCISGNWGTDGPARNRFYAFDKVTG